MIKKITKIIFLVLVVVLLTGCTKKEALSSLDFVDFMETKEYQTTNVIEQFKDYSQIKNAFIAQNKDITYQIEYYELSTEKDAITFYEGNRDIFKKTDKKVSLRTEKEFEHDAKYVQLTESAYSIVSRIDNTIIYLNVEPTYKNEIDKLLLSIGY